LACGRRRLVADGKERQHSGRGEKDVTPRHENVYITPQLPPYIFHSRSFSTPAGPHTIDEFHFRRG
jgi:hypothetical protein